MNTLIPLLINEEAVWDKSQTIVSKTDLYGTIEYANDAFVEVSGYQEYELVGSPHNIIRHPDTPKVIFKLMWDTISKGQKFHAVIKNLSKSGRYYWVITDFDYILNDDAQIVKYISRRKAVSENVIKKVEVLYNKLLQIEEAKGVESSEKYLIGYLEEMGLTFVQYVTKLMIEDAKEKSLIHGFSLIEETIEELERNKKNYFSRLFVK